MTHYATIFKQHIIFEVLFLLLQKEVEQEIAKFEEATKKNLVMIANSGMLVPCDIPFIVDNDSVKTQASVEAQCELGFQLSGYGMPVTTTEQLSLLNKPLSPSKSSWDSAFESGSDLSTEDSSDDDCGNDVYFYQQF